MPPLRTECPPGGGVQDFALTFAAMNDWTFGPCEASRWNAPVWMMRQAGRTLPEYRAVRAEAGGFKDLLTPDRAAVTLQPIDAYGDAAILFSDILVVPEAMGLPYNLVEKVGPRFPETIRSSSDLARLHEVDPDRDLKYVLDAVRIILRGSTAACPSLDSPALLGPCSVTWWRGTRTGPSRAGCSGKNRRPDAPLGITAATKAYLHARSTQAFTSSNSDSWAGPQPRPLRPAHPAPHAGPPRRAAGPRPGDGVCQRRKPLLRTSPPCRAPPWASIGKPTADGRATLPTTLREDPSPARQPRPGSALRQSWHLRAETHRML